MILSRACCRSTVNSETLVYKPLPCNATMEATSIFFAVRSGNDVIPTVGESERCFLCGPFTGYIVQSQWQLRVSCVEYSTAERLQLVSNGKGCHKSWLQQWLQCWSLSLQWKRIDSIVVSCEAYTL
jgi:hypothetical protein